MVKNAPIFINGNGKTAQLTCLALLAAGFEVISPAFAVARQMTRTTLPAPPAPPAKTAHWQNVLAISPSTRALLTRLNVWQHLTYGTAEIAAMDIYADRYGYLPITAPDTDTPLATIIATADLSQAIATALCAICDSKVQNNYQNAEAAVAYAADKRQLTDAGGAIWECALVIDTDSASALDVDSALDMEAMTYDYQAQALVAQIETSHPHKNRACQIFLPSGPLALLPLPAPNRVALVWSLPHAQAHTLAQLDEKTFLQILTHHYRTRDDRMRFVACGARQCHPLTLSLADAAHTPRTILLGEAAHRVHPLAGQGFNISARDIAAVVDSLKDARHLGLDIGTHTPAHYQTQRRGDAGTNAFITHLLAKGFSLPALNTLGGLGFDVLRTTPALHAMLRAALIALADSGATQSHTRHNLMRV